MNVSAAALGEDKIHDDVTIDPKILEPYVPIPGNVPRKVALDRKKKEYQSFHIE
jgi:dynein heavy chain, axonemal